MIPAHPTRRPGSVLAWRSAAASHVGCVRRQNQDAFCSNPEQGIWCVADGMGGHTAGERAARLLADTLALQQAGLSLDVTAARLQAAIERVNSILSTDSVLGSSGGICGSTIVTVALTDNEGACLWAGDSRLYLCRAGQLRQISRDHSLVQELVEKRLIEPHEARLHPQRHVITRAVGANLRLELDQVRFSVQAGDQLLLCSDGLHCELDADTIRQVLVQQSDCENKVNQLIEHALACGARDNVTVNLIELMLHDGNTG